MSAPWFPMYSSDWLAGTSGLSAAEKGVYITLVCLMYEAEAPIERDDTRLARQCGAPVPTFRKALDGLIRARKILVVEGGLWNDKVDEVCKLRSQKRVAARESANARWGKNAKENNATKMRTHSERNANQNHNQSRDTNVSLAREDEFDAFWAIVPRKAGKGKARKAYAAALKKADAATLLSAMERYAAERAGKDAQYTAHPATWLNGERWLDEAPAPKRSILDAIDERFANGLGLPEPSGPDYSGRDALSAPIPSAGTPDGRSGPSGGANDCGGGERAHLKLIQPRRFGGCSG